MHTYIYTDRQTDRQIDRQTNRQTDRDGFSVMAAGDALPPATRNPSEWKMGERQEGGRARGGTHTHTHTKTHTIKYGYP